MLQKVIITESGDSSLLVGEQYQKNEIIELNKTLSNPLTFSNWIYKDPLLFVNGGGKFIPDA